MRSIFKRNSQAGLRVVFLVGLSIILMVMDKKLESFATLRSAISLPIAPFQYMVSWPIQLFDELKTRFKSHQQLVEVNSELKAEQLVLKTQLQRLLALETENEYLKSLQGSSRKVQGKTLIAELLAVDSEPFIKQVILNKGSRDNVYVGQPVLDADGVMGQLIQVGPITSRVLLVNDPHSGMAVQSARNGLRAIAVGDSYSGKLRLLYVPKTADVRVDDIFMTSGLGDHYPEGYPVGKVYRVDNDPNQQFMTIYLQPSAHVDSSRQVLLVWYQKHV